MLTDEPRTWQSCVACAEITERSQTYGRWLVHENHSDAATLARVAGARGYCGPHARRLLEMEPDVAAIVARAVLRTVAHELREQLATSRGYQNALDPQEPCPWCVIESNALDLALHGRGSAGAKLCSSHARMDAMKFRSQHVLPDSPQPPCQTLDIPQTGVSGEELSWWAPSIDELWEALRKACAACIAARKAEAKREAFLHRGPTGGEHWDPITLCLAHASAFNLEPLERVARSSAPTPIPHECSVCSAARRAESRTARLLALAFANAVFRDAYAHVRGLCLPHTRRALANIKDRALRNAVASSALDRVDALLWELEERAVLRSWSFRDQGVPDFASDLSARSWWSIAGSGSWRVFQNHSRR
jgi:hypothetical protein